jgi:DNA-binding NtrC family response regulator
MGGEETIQLLKEYDPRVNALVSSGYSSRDAMAEFSRYGFNGILPKPYQINELMDTIARHIDHKADV